MESTDGNYGGGKPVVMFLVFFVWCGWHDNRGSVGGGVFCWWGWCVGGGGSRKSYFVEL